MGLLLWLCSAVEAAVSRDGGRSGRALTTPLSWEVPLGGEVIALTRVGGGGAGRCRPSDPVPFTFRVGSMNAGSTAKSVRIDGRNDIDDASIQILLLHSTQWLVYGNILIKLVPYVYTNIQGLVY